MEKKKYLFPDFTIAAQSDEDVIVMSNTAFDSDGWDNVIGGTGGEDIL